MAQQLVYVQELFLKNLEEDIFNLNMLSEDEKTEHKLKSYIKILESDFNDARKYHSQIIKIEDKDDASIIQNYLSKATMNQIRKQYHSYWAALNASLDSKMSTFLSSTVSASQTEKTQSYDLKLPRISIPTFDGKYDEWNDFYNLFVATVQNNKSLEPVQKLHYLTQAVTGEAHGHIKNLTLTNTNYEIAMGILKDQYDHKRKVAHIYVTKLLDYPIIKTECAKELKDLLSNIKDCSASLKQLELPVDHWDFILLCIMQQKIPKSTYREWEKKLGAAKEIPQLQQFQSFLEETYRMLEMVEPSPKEGNKKIFIFRPT